MSDAPSWTPGTAAPSSPSIDPSVAELASPDTAALMAELSARGLTLGVAESLTGGLLTAELVRPPGASAVVNGGIVAYQTELKRDLLGVDGELLEREGPVHAEVARQMADRVRRAVAIDGRPADLGIATTGVAGPDPQGDAEVGTVFIGVAVGDTVEAVRLELDGGRDRIRARTVSEAIAALATRL